MDPTLQDQMTGTPGRETILYVVTPLSPTFRWMRGVGVEPTELIPITSRASNRAAWSCVAPLASGSQLAQTASSCLGLSRNEAGGVPLVAAPRGG